MASAALVSANDTPPAPKPGRQTIIIPIADIVVGQRLRPLNPLWAQALGQLIKRDGHKTPIEVCRLPGRTDYLLVAGLHRLEGCRLIGRVEIEAEVTSAERAKRRLAEVSENLFRRELAPLERAAFVAELFELLRAEAGVSADTKPQSIAAQVRWDRALQDEAADASGAVQLAYGFAEEVAAILGFSKDTIYRDLALHRGLEADVAAIVQGMDGAANAGQLRALAKLDPAEQRATAQLLADGAAATVGDALDTVRKVTPADAAKKRANAFTGAWARMSAAEKRAALVSLQPLLPKGVRLVGKGFDNA